MNIREWWDSYWPSKVAYSRMLILDNVIFLYEWAYKRTKEKELPLAMQAAYAGGYYDAMQGIPRNNPYARHAIDKRGAAWDQGYDDCVANGDVV